GELIVLMNGGSFSCTGAVLAALEDRQRALLIGQAAAGNKRVFCGGGKEIVLPHSGIRLTVPEVQFRIINQNENTRHGVMPDVELALKIEDVLAKVDPFLDAAMYQFR
ncbi:MAG: S41 family peptidase, partial [Bacteroidota bacterium]